MKKRRKQRGFITVFVTLLMIPVVTISGIMVDVSRLKMYSSQAVMAADSYGDAILSEYDNLLKELYGLFSMTQNEEGLSAIEDYATYLSYSFNPNGDESGFDGFMPYKDTDVELTYTKVEGASLTNHDVLMTQISDFMRFRVIEEVLEEGGILSAIESFQGTEKDSELIEERSKITEKSAEALKKIDAYYQILKKFTDYPGYVNYRANNLDETRAKITGYFLEFGESEQAKEYEKYVYYTKNKDSVKKSVEYYKEIEEILNSKDEEVPVIDEDLYEEGKYYAEHDPETYKENLKTTLDGYLAHIKNKDLNKQIDFDSVSSTLKDLKAANDDLSGELDSLDTAIANLKIKAAQSSSEVSQGIQEEIKDLEGILKLKDQFQETYDILDAEIENENKYNKEIVDQYIEKMEVLCDALVEGTADYKQLPTAEVPLHPYDFRDGHANAKQFYKDLQTLCAKSAEEDEGQKQKKEVSDRADRMQEDAMGKFEGEEKTAARDIPDALKGELKASASDEVTSVLSYFNGGLSFGSIGTHLIDRFLVTTYDMGMFSSRVSGIDPKEELSVRVDDSKPAAGAPKNTHKGGEASQDETYADYSLTGIKMSENVNYLYGAELEYLFGGNISSDKNLTSTRNVIAGIRMVLNFGSTYAVKEVNTAINTISASVAAFFGPAAPLIKVTVSTLLRTAAAAVEAGADWDALKKREEVVFIKTKWADLESKELLMELLPELEVSSTEPRTKFALSYEDYIYAFLNLIVSEEDLLQRTSALITLNVNQAQQKVDKLETLKFKMSNTVTAVEATCKVKSDFVIVPDYMAELFISGTKANTSIEVLEDHYFGYSVIRGY